MLRRLTLVGAIAVLAIGVLAPAAMAGAEKATICHKPGTPAEHTLVVAAPAVKAHVAHGDVPGDCGGSPTVDGCATLNDPKYDGRYVGALLNGLIFSGPWEHPWIRIVATSRTPFTAELDGYPNPDRQDAVYIDSEGYYWLPGWDLDWPPRDAPVSIGWSTVTGGRVTWEVTCYTGD